MTYEEYKKMIEENEDRMEEFIRSVPLQEFFNSVTSKLELDNLHFNVNYVSGGRRRYRVPCDTVVDFASDNIADTNPIFKIAFSEVILTPFGCGRLFIKVNNKIISARNYEELEYSNKPEFEFFTNLHLSYKSHGGGENGNHLCEASYTEKDGWKIEWANDYRR